jgi:hypothetical protein
MMNPYQMFIAAAGVASCFNSGRKTTLIGLATGNGKSLISIMMAWYLSLGPHSQTTPQRVIVVSPTKLLSDELETRYCNMARTHGITFVTVDEFLMAKIDSEAFVVVDEIDTMLGHQRLHAVAEGRPLLTNVTFVDAEKILVGYKGIVGLTASLSAMA